MFPPVEIQNRDNYKRRMRELLDVNPKRTVVLTVDMQRDYLDIDVATSPVPPELAESLIKNTTRLLAACRLIGVPVIHCYVSRRPAEAARGSCFSVYGRTSGEAHLSQNPNAAARRGIDRVAGSAEAEVEGLLVDARDVHMDTKRQMDSFYQTDLDMLIGRVFRAETVIITGINTDTCVYATALGASCRGYAPVIVSDCVASMRGHDHHWMALELMSRTMAWVLDIDETLAKLGGVGTSGTPLDE